MATQCSSDHLYFFFIIAHWFATPLNCGSAMTEVVFAMTERGVYKGGGLPIAFQLPDYFPVTELSRQPGLRNLYPPLQLVIAICATFNPVIARPQAVATQCFLFTVMLVH
ncbi:MAG: hypothetical protein HS120_09830 [Burkholderiales bacterium]|nr:hypothetical protein [Burkholderiales bacterium]